MTRTCSKLVFQETFFGLMCFAREKVDLPAYQPVTRMISANQITPRRSFPEEEKVPCFVRKFEPGWSDCGRFSQADNPRLPFSPLADTCQASSPAIVCPFRSGGGSALQSVLPIPSFRR